MFSRGTGPSRAGRGFMGSGLGYRFLPGLSFQRRLVFRWGIALRSFCLGRWMFRARRFWSFGCCGLGLRHRRPGG